MILIHKNNKSAVLKQSEIVIVGAGISGATLAERYSAHGKKVLVIEKRNHIGGNCYDFINKYGIRVSKYGAHLFHTNYEDVWEYVNKFSKWYPYEHRVRAHVGNKLVPIPVNIDTVNMLFDTHIQNEEEMKAWLNSHITPFSNPKNGEEASLNAVGKELYELLFKNYTFKQWAKYPYEMDASVLKRIPVRTNHDDRYFTDKYQALPENGYTHLFQNILAGNNISLLLNTDFMDIRDRISYEKLFYTGPIDRFFGNSPSRQPREKLEYRSIRFIPKTYLKEYYQDYAVVNYPNTYAFTRIVEYKHITKQRSKYTTVVREYTTDEGEPYYPVPNPRNSIIYEQYRKMTEELKDIHFVGRLANYKYFNMDQAFKNALDLFNSLENGKTNTNST